MKLFLHEKIWWQKFSKNKDGALKIARVFKYNVWRRKLNYLLKVYVTLYAFFFAMPKNEPNELFFSSDAFWGMDHAAWFSVYRRCLVTRLIASNIIVKVKS